MHKLFESIANLYTEQQELAAIWLEKPVITGQGRTRRIAPDMTVTVIDNELVDVTGEPTHKVLACFGTLTSQFEIAVVDIQTSEPSIIKF